MRFALISGVIQAVLSSMNDVWHLPLKNAISESKFDDYIFYFSLMGSYLSGDDRHGMEGHSGLIHDVKPRLSNIQKDSEWFDNSQQDIHSLKEYSSHTILNSPNETPVFNNHNIKYYILKFLNSCNENLNNIPYQCLNLGYFNSLKPSLSFKKIDNSLLRIWVFPIISYVAHIKFSGDAELNEFIKTTNIAEYDRTVSHKPQHVDIPLYFTSVKGNIEPVTVLMSELSIISCRRRTNGKYEVGVDKSANIIYTSSPTFCPMVQNGKVEKYIHANTITCTYDSDKSYLFKESKIVDEDRMTAFTELAMLDGRALTIFEDELFETHNDNRFVFAETCDKIIVHQQDASKLEQCDTHTRTIRSPCFSMYATRLNSQTLTVVLFNVQNTLRVNCDDIEFSRAPELRGTFDDGYIDIPRSGPLLSYMKLTYSGLYMYMPSVFGSHCLPIVKKRIFAKNITGQKTCYWVNAQLFHKYFPWPTQIIKEQGNVLFISLHGIFDIDEVFTSIDHSHVTIKDCASFIVRDISFFDPDYDIDILHSSFDISKLDFSESECSSSIHHGVIIFGPVFKFEGKKYFTDDSDNCPWFYEASIKNDKTLFIPIFNTESISISGMSDVAQSPSKIIKTDQPTLVVFRDSVEDVTHQKHSVILSFAGKPVEKNIYTPLVRVKCIWPDYEQLISRDKLNSLSVIISKYDTHRIQFGKCASFILPGKYHPKRGKLNFEIEIDSIDLSKSACNIDGDDYGPVFEYNGDSYYTEDQNFCIVFIKISETDYYIPTYGITPKEEEDPAFIFKIGGNSGYKYTFTQVSEYSTNDVIFSSNEDILSRYYPPGETESSSSSEIETPTQCPWPNIDEMFEKLKQNSDGEISNFKKLSQILNKECERFYIDESLEFFTVDGKKIDDKIYINKINLHNSKCNPVNNIYGPIFKIEDDIEVYVNHQYKCPHFIKYTNLNIPIFPDKLINFQSRSDQVYFINGIIEGILPNFQRDDIDGDYVEGIRSTHDEYHLLKYLTSSRQVECLWPHDTWKVEIGDNKNSEIKNLKIEYKNSEINSIQFKRLNNINGDCKLYFVQIPFKIFEIKDGVSTSIEIPRIRKKWMKIVHMDKIALQNSICQWNSKYNLFGPIFIYIDLLDNEHEVFVEEISNCPSFLKIKKFYIPIFKTIMPSIESTHIYGDIDSVHDKYLYKFIDSRESVGDFHWRQSIQEGKNLFIPKIPCLLPSHLDLYLNGEEGRLLTDEDKIVKFEICDDFYLNFKNSIISIKNLNIPKCEISENNCFSFIESNKLLLPIPIGEFKGPQGHRGAGDNFNIYNENGQFKITTNGIYAKYTINGKIVYMPHKVYNAIFPIHCQWPMHDLIQRLKPTITKADNLLEFGKRNFKKIKNNKEEINLEDCVSILLSLNNIEYSIENVDISSSQCGYNENLMLFGPIFKYNGKSIYSENINDCLSFILIDNLLLPIKTPDNIDLDNVIYPDNIPNYPKILNYIKGQITHYDIYTPQILCEYPIYLDKLVQSNLQFRRVVSEKIIDIFIKLDQCHRYIIMDDFKIKPLYLDLIDFTKGLSCHGDIIGSVGGSINTKSQGKAKPKELEGKLIHKKELKSSTHCPVFMQIETYILPTLIMKNEYMSAKLEMIDNRFYLEKYNKIFYRKTKSLNDYPFIYINNLYIFKNYDCNWPDADNVIDKINQNNIDIFHQKYTTGELQVNFDQCEDFYFHPHFKLISLEGNSISLINIKNILSGCRKIKHNNDNYYGPIYQENNVDYYVKDPKNCPIFIYSQFLSFYLPFFRIHSDLMNDFQEESKVFCSRGRGLSFKESKILNYEEKQTQYIKKQDIKHNIALLEPSTNVMKELDTTFNKIFPELSDNRYVIYLHDETKNKNSLDYSQSLSRHEATVFLCRSKFNIANLPINLNSHTEEHEITPELCKDPDDDNFVYGLDIYDSLVRCSESSSSFSGYSVQTDVSNKGRNSMEIVLRKLGQQATQLLCVLTSECSDDKSIGESIDKRIDESKQCKICKGKLHRFTFPIITNCGKCIYITIYGKGHLHSRLLEILTMCPLYNSGLTLNKIHTSNRFSENVKYKKLVKKNKELTNKFKPYIERITHMMEDKHTQTRFSDYKNIMCNGGKFVQYPTTCLNRDTAISKLCTYDEPHRAEETTKVETNNCVDDNGNKLKEPMSLLQSTIDNIVNDENIIYQPRLKDETNIELIYPNTVTLYMQRMYSKFRRINYIHRYQNFITLEKTKLKSYIYSKLNCEYDDTDIETSAFCVILRNLFKIHSQLPGVLTDINERPIGTSQWRFHKWQNEAIRLQYDLIVRNLMKYLYLLKNIENKEHECFNNKDGVIDCINEYYDEMPRYMLFSLFQ